MEESKADIWELNAELDVDDMGQANMLSESILDCINQEAINHGIIGVAPAVTTLGKRLMICVVVPGCMETGMIEDCLSETYGIRMHSRRVRIVQSD